MKRAIIALVFAAGTVFPSIGSAVEPRIFLIGVWPNRVRFFDEQTDQFTGEELQLRYGAITNVFGSDSTADHRRFFFITDRMEAVEVADIPSKSVVDEVKLSSPDKKIRFFGAAPDPTGKELYLTAKVVGLEVDRFVPEKVDVIRYDLGRHQVVETFGLPKEIELDFPGPMHFSRDGSSLYVIGRDVFVLDTKTHEIVDRIEMSKARAPGYPAIGGLGLIPVEGEPGVLYGVYRGQDPFMKKTMLGIARVDLDKRLVDSFEVSPDLKVEWFGLSPDLKRGYAGMGDLIAVDMESRKVLRRRERVEQGRQNTAMVVSADGTKLYVAGVGPLIRVYDSTTLEETKQINAGGDIMNPPQPIPRSALSR